MLSRSLAPLIARFEEAGVLAAVSYRIKTSAVLIASRNLAGHWLLFALFLFN
jgi:hypothetical protein